MVLKDMNDLFVKDCELHIRYAEGFHCRWMGAPNNRRLQYERITAVEIYMLCPQLGAIHHGQDIERFINWFSESQVSLQGRGRIEYNTAPFR